MSLQSKEILSEAQNFFSLMFSELLSGLGPGPGNIGIETETSGLLAVLCSCLAGYSSLFIKA